MKLGKLSSFLGVLFVVLLFVVGGLSKQDKTQKNSKAAPAEKSSEEKKTETAVSKGNPAKGEEIFEARCGLCHDAKSETVKVGPGLKGLFKKPPHKLSNGKAHTHNVEFVRHQIEKGSGLMPPQEGIVSEKEIDDLVAYLQTL